jgi:hypothetical protein
MREGSVKPNFERSLTQGRSSEARAGHPAAAKLTTAEKERITTSCWGRRMFQNQQILFVAAVLNITVLRTSMAMDA